MTTPMLASVPVAKVAAELKQLIIERLGVDDDEIVKRLFTWGPDRVVPDDPNEATLIDAYDILRHGSRNRW